MLHQDYVDVGEFAGHLCALLRAGTVNKFSTVFAAVEHLLEEGDEDACNAVTTGLLEDLYFKAETQISPRESGESISGQGRRVLGRLICCGLKRVTDRVCLLTNCLSASASSMDNLSV